MTLILSDPNDEWPNSESSLYAEHHPQALETYQDAIAAGHSAFLLEESDASGDVFECHVGNLPPHTDAEICFSYVVELAVEAKDGAVKFVYPAVLGGRYQTDAAHTGMYLFWVELYFLVESSP